MRLSTLFLTVCLVWLSACAAIQEEVLVPTRPSAPVQLSPRRPDPMAIRAEVIEEINRVRTNPKAYADLMSAHLESYRGLEGKAAIRETIDVLRATVPLRPLEPLEALESAALDHVADQSKSGLRGHRGSDGSDPFDRVRRYLNTNGAGENIAYGLWNAREMVMALLIDDGIPSRGHRKNILNPSYRLIGVAAGEHPEYRIVCVMDFAYPPGH